MRALAERQGPHFIARLKNVMTHRSHEDEMQPSLERALPHRELLKA